MIIEKAKNEDKLTIISQHLQIIKGKLMEIKKKKKQKIKKWNY